MHLDRNPFSYEASLGKQGTPPQYPPPTHTHRVWGPCPALGGQWRISGSLRKEENYFDNKPWKMRSILFSI